ncbi:hypothetical protein D9615_001667 [Tricholomella constricta]|uniref:Piwi domain-containing protein n=1 Tax=Tricholomella constricta TaxID=117010 RepID=A0A8H5HNW7_9AGAR|nr:hypothetical protein D9615_001667 [Tricholomella constricta]
MLPRPGGTVGAKVQARTNAFEMKWNRAQGNSGYVYHYDVILPLWDTGSREFKLGNKKGSELVMRLQTSTRPDLFNPLGAYDGKKNLFSFQGYRVSSEEFRVPWEDGQSHHRKEVSIRVVFVKKIDVGTLGRLVKGDPESLNPESDAATAINMLNLFIQSTPRMQDPNSFFDPFLEDVSNLLFAFIAVPHCHDTDVSDKIRPLELWRGHFQSVRATFDRIIVNVDVTVGVVLPRGPLENVCGEYLHLRNIRDLHDRSEPNVRKLRLFLKGVKVEVDLPGHAGKRPKTIRDVLYDVGKMTFEKGGETISIADHFEHAHNYKIRSGSIGVRLGKDGIFPISVCRTTQQLYKNRASPDVVREALAFSPTCPSKRLEAIRAGWQELKYTQSPFLLGAGISVKPEPLHVKGRILPPPNICFGDGFELTLQRQGQWDVMRKTFNKAAELPSWTVVDFATCDMSVLSTFVLDLVQEMGKRGMTVSQPHNILRRPGSANVRTVLDDAIGEAGAQMILVILPESAAHIYREVKRYGDITRGVVTQCVKWSRKLANDAQQRRANQYHNNLILKINAKLGGINCVPVNPAMAYLALVPTMVLGADVSHPAPGSVLPSISALVASMDKKMSRYAASIRVQTSRTEIIEDFAEMFEIALQNFKKRNNALPQRLFMFRDGVSEGEFKTVLDMELNAMKTPLMTAYGSDLARWPGVTFIVVGKRHHFRFFPLDRQSEDPRGNGNLHAGFVVDQDIVHPVYRDFYLQSQPGLKGTSRPSHYTVLRNDNTLHPKDKKLLGADELQQIAYALCHCYSRATRSVKIPAPVYYADLVCRRAKFHFSDAIGDIDAMSASSDERQHLDYYKAQFDGINNRLKDTMYFV